MSLTRKDFIYKSLMTTTGLLLFNGCKHDPVVMPQNKKIIIVGAGISGLSAAFELSNAGIDVLVLEANNRIGGRINSIDFAGMKADLGASWIHGNVYNPLYDFAKKHNIKTVFTKEEPEYIYDIDGSDITNEDWGKWEKFLNILVEQSQTYSNISLQELIDEFWNQYALDSKTERIFNGGIRLELEIPYAEDAYRLASNVLQNDGYYPGKHSILPGGMSSIIDILAMQTEVRFNTYVTKIDYTGDKVRIYATNSGDVPFDRSCNACHTNTKSIEINENIDFEADLVLITVPVSILKNNAIDFEPQLPEYKAGAIKNIQMGLMNKVYMKFDEVFWPEDSRFFSQLKASRSEIMEMMNMKIINGKPVLIAFFGARHAKHIETLSKNDLIELLYNEMKNMFGGDIPAPIEIERSGWHQNMFSLGSYPVIPPGFTNKLFTDMSKNIDNKLFFAGDATEKIHYASAHGAYKSGIRAANEIISIIK
jgi:monoamine oxidase